MDLQADTESPSLANPPLAEYETRRCLECRAEKRLSEFEIKPPAGALVDRRKLGRRCHTCRPIHAERRAREVAAERKLELQARGQAVVRQCLKCDNHFRSHHGNRICTTCKTGFSCADEVFIGRYNVAL